MHDVWRGVFDALKRRADVEIVQYAMDQRIGFAGEYLKLLYSRNKRQGMPKPSPADTLYLAGQGILERAVRHMVDWVLLISGTYVHLDTVVILRRTGLKVAVLLTESPFANGQENLVAERCNVVWTNERISVPFFEQYCERVHYWRHAYDPARHHPESNGLECASHDAVFVGTGWIERQQFLGAIDWSGIDFGLYGSWGFLGSRNRLREHLHAGIVKNQVTAELYRRARVGLNLHRTSVGLGRNVPHIEDAESLNPRCYELAACGCFFINDRRAEIGEVFGALVPTFDTPQEAEQLIRYYLEHDEERERIAAQLPEKVRQHTFDNRVAEMVSILED